MTASLTLLIGSLSAPASRRSCAVSVCPLYTACMSAVTPSYAYVQTCIPLNKPKKRESGYST